MLNGHKKYCIFVLVLVSCVSCTFTGRFKLAEVDLQQALELKPDFEDALLNLNQVRRDLQTGYQFNITEN